MTMFLYYLFMAVRYEFCSPALMLATLAGLCVLLVFALICVAAAVTPAKSAKPSQK